MSKTYGKKKREEEREEEREEKKKEGGKGLFRSAQLKGKTVCVSKERAVCR